MNEPATYASIKPLNTAVLFLTFNRLDTTQQVFEAIRRARPPRLYFASDGPRDSRPGEDENVKTIRNYVIGHIDWECEVKTLLREKNLGCKYAVSSAISWFFDNEEMGIILEDDCLPSQSFFAFCEELLKIYKNDERIFMITGYNKQNTWNLKYADYHFSHIGQIWGWASWRRAWKHYDINMNDLQAFVQRKYLRYLFGDKLGMYQERVLRNTLDNSIDTWDYQWNYAMHKNSGMSCFPSKNLIINIGFGENATHTKGSNKDHLETHEYNFPLKINNFMVADKKYDTLMLSQPYTRRIINRFQRIINVFVNIFRKKRD